MDLKFCVTNKCKNMDYGCLRTGQRKENLDLSGKK
jgi:hypothetical protein